MRQEGTQGERREEKGKWERKRMKRKERGGKKKGKSVLAFGVVLLFHSNLLQLQL